jgi:hypothetical protein
VHISHMIVRSARDAVNLSDSLRSAEKLCPYKEKVRRVFWLKLVRCLWKNSRTVPDTKADLLWRERCRG